MFTFQAGNYQVGNGLRSRDSLHMKASERIIDWTERFYLFIHFVCIPIGEKYLFKKIQRILSCYLLLAQTLPALGTPPKQAGNRTNFADCPHSQGLLVRNLKLVFGGVG